MTLPGQTLPVSLIVKAKQKTYPMELSSSEIYSHMLILNEYKEDYVKNIISISEKCNPNIELINQQPKMPPQKTRRNMVTFMFQLATVCRVTNSIFLHAVRLYDRYSSKRIVLKEQSKLVVGTSLWLSAKALGGCSHIINERVIPTGGRFYGPGPRARVPRLAELVYYCGGRQIFNESMFLQMERHILNTLNWDICEPTINDMILNVDENCLIQYECYRQAFLQNHIKNESALEQTDSKIEMINIKLFLADLTAWQYELLDYSLFEISNSILNLLTKFTKHAGTSFVPFSDNSEKLLNQDKIMEILINSVVNTPSCLFDIYKNKPFIRAFVINVTEYQAKIILQQQTAAVMSARRTSIVNKTFSIKNAPSYNQSNYSSPASVNIMTFSELDIDGDNSTDETDSDTSTPIRKASTQSTNSVFSSCEIGGKTSTPLTLGDSSGYGKIQHSPLNKEITKDTEHIVAHSTFLSNDFIKSDNN